MEVGIPGSVVSCKMEMYGNVKIQRFNLKKPSETVLAQLLHLQGDMNKIYTFSDFSDYHLNI